MTTSRSCFFSDKSFSSSTTNGVPAKKSVRSKPKRRCQFMRSLFAFRMQTHHHHFFGRPPHISSSAKGWIGPLGFGLGRDLRTASARNRSDLVVIFTFVDEPSTT